MLRGQPEPARSATQETPAREDERGSTHGDAWVVLGLTSPDGQTVSEPSDIGKNPPSRAPAEHSRVGEAPGLCCALAALSCQENPPPSHGAGYGVVIARLRGSRLGGSPGLQGGAEHRAARQAAHSHAPQARSCQPCE